MKQIFINIGQKVFFIRGIMYPYMWEKLEYLCNYELRCAHFIWFFPLTATPVKNLLNGFSGFLLFLLKDKHEKNMENVTNYITFA